MAMRDTLSPASAHMAAALAFRGIHPCTPAHVEAVGRSNTICPFMHRMPVGGGGGDSVGIV